MVDMNFMKEGNESPLILAARNGHKDVVKCLLDKGAMPNIASLKGFTPLLRADWKGHKDIVHLCSIYEWRKATKKMEGLSQTWQLKME